MTGMPRMSRRRPWQVGVLAGLVLLALVACGASEVSPSAPDAAASPSGSALASDEPMPSPTRWPGGVVEAVMILGKADAQIRQAGDDLAAAAADEDLEAMWGAADGLATLIERLQTQVPRIAEYPVSAKAAAAYEAALPDMLAGAVKVRDAITAGDAKALEEGSVQLSRGTAAYENARAEIGPLVDQALLMQKLLTK
jgi:hypothetical protein